MFLKMGFCVYLVVFSVLSRVLMEGLWIFRCFLVALMVFRRKRAGSAHYFVWKALS